VLENFFVQKIFRVSVPHVVKKKRLPCALQRDQRALIESRVLFINSSKEPETKILEIRRKRHLEIRRTFETLRA
jgi:hypothetical protein